MATHQIPSPLSHSDEEIFYQAMTLTSASTLPMVLNSAIQLNLFHLINDAGPTASLSAADLASLIPASDPHHAANQIDRILRFLSAHSVVSCTLQPLPDGNVQRLYSLLPVCKYLTPDENGNSFTTSSLMVHSKVIMDSWYHVTDMVLEGGGIPFNRAHGMPIYEYASTNPEFNHLFNQGLHEFSSIIVNKLLQLYDGFLGIKSLVDVGGGTGATLQAILAKFPNIEKAINFDLPHVVSNAPPHPRIDHVGGDMFIAVPKADVIFMKGVLHNWGDEDCTKVLKNCYEALPEKGKVVVLDMILMREPKEGKGSDWAAFEYAARLDVLMLATNPGGKERSEEEIDALAKSAGFKRFVKVCYAYTNWVMEFHK